jgi:microcystin-dependent protein
MASSANAAVSQPTATSVLAAPGAPSGREFNNTFGYNDSTPDITLAATSVREQVVGGGQPFKTMPPYMGMSYIICMEGLYPSRP